MADDGPRSSGETGMSLTIREHFAVTQHALDERLGQRIDYVEKEDAAAICALKAAVGALDQRITERLQALSILGDQRSEFSERAINKASESMEKRLDGMNEFRATLKDQALLYIARTEVETILRALNDRIDRRDHEVDMKVKELGISSDNRFKPLEAQMNNSAGRIAAYGTALVILNAVIAIAIHFLPKS